MNTEVNAINTLERASYHQENQTVNNYLNGFQTLVSNAGYINL